MGIFLRYTLYQLCKSQLGITCQNAKPMSKTTKFSALLGKTNFFSRIFRRKKTAFAKQRRLLRGDYNLF